MSPVARDRVDLMLQEVHAVLAGTASDVFMKRIDGIIDEWASGKINAGEACEKVQKVVSLFISEEKAREIGTRCAPIVMRESARTKS